MRNNIKLLAIAGIMASVLVFSPVLRAGFAEGTRLEASATTEATTTTVRQLPTETIAAVGFQQMTTVMQSVGSYGVDGIMRKTTFFSLADGTPITEKIIFHQLFQMILRVFLLAAMFSVIHTGRFSTGYCKRKDGAPDMS